MIDHYSAIGFNKDIHQIRSCSKAERANFTGEKRRRMFVEKLKETKGIKHLESNMPTSKTVRVFKYSTCLQYVLEHLQTLFSFYGSKSAPFSIYEYQGKQRANEEIANMLLLHGAKDKKRPDINFHIQSGDTIIEIVCGEVKKDKAGEVEAKIRVIEVMKRQLHLKMKLAKKMHEVETFGILVIGTEITLLNMHMDTSKWVYVYEESSPFKSPTTYATYQNMDVAMAIMLGFKHRMEIPLRTAEDDNNDNDVWKSFQELIFFNNFQMYDPGLSFIAFIFQLLYSQQPIERRIQRSQYIEKRTQYKPRHMIFCKTLTKSKVGKLQKQLEAHRVMLQKTKEIMDKEVFSKSNTVYKKIDKSYQTTDKDAKIDNDNIN
ncbi:MAG: hypothetical protein EXX96DRAFT_541081 [Benjaminiella poitrasii]|nr:MAG: hypothetical protein EXX96DRAFT_541081 [Benjaminiella poitrasii]